MQQGNFGNTEPPNGPVVAKARHAAPKSRFRTWALRSAKILVVAVLMVWIVRNAETESVFSAMRQANLPLVVLALAMQILGAAIMAARWRLLLQVQDVSPSFAYLFTSTVSAFFFRQFLPSVVGGDAIRSVAAWRAGADPGFAALSLVADRLFGLLALLLFLIGASFFMMQIAADLPGLWGGLAAAGAIVGGGLLFLMAPGSIRLPAKTPAKIDRVVRATRVFAGSHRIVPACLGLSILLQVNVVTFYWVIGHALGLEVPYAAYYVIVPIAIFVMMVPFSINAIGIREVIFIYLLGVWGVDSDLALAFAWAEFGIILCAGLLGGIVYMTHKMPARTDIERSGAETPANAT